MKNICFIMPNLNGGGAERVVSELSSSLSANGYNVLVAFLKSARCEYILDEKVDKLLLNKKKKGPIQQICYIRKLMKSNLNTTYISFLPHQNIYTVIAATGLNVRIVLSLRNDPRRIMGGSFWKRKIHTFILSKSDVVVFQTDDAAKHYKNIGDKKKVVILNPISEKLPEYSFKDLESEKYVVTFCRLNSQKNLELAINAFADFYESFPEYKFYIYGEGEEEQNLLELIMKMGLEGVVNIKPFTNDIHIIAKKARMFVLSSDYEGLSNSMIESMAIGVPTICTDCPIGGARMVIRNYENGILVEKNNVSELSKAMELVASDESFAKKISKNAKKIKSELSTERIMKLWEEVI